MFSSHQKYLKVVVVLLVVLCCGLLLARSRPVPPQAAPPTAPPSSPPAAAAQLLALQTELGRLREQLGRAAQSVRHNKLNFDWLVSPEPWKLCLLLDLAIWHRC